MGVIRTDADRRVDALIEEDKRQWFTAHKIASLATQDERKAALDALEQRTDHDFRNFIESRSREVYENRKAKASALADHASRNYQKVFKGEQGSGAKRGITGTVRRKPKTGAAAHVASMLDSLSEGVSA